MNSPPHPFSLLRSWCFNPSIPSTLWPSSRSSRSRRSSSPSSSTAADPRSPRYYYYCCYYDYLYYECHFCYTITTTAATTITQGCHSNHCRCERCAFRETPGQRSCVADWKLDERVAAVLPSRGGACAAVAWHAVLGLMCCRRAAELALLSHGMLCWGCCLPLGLLFGVGAAVLGLGLGLLFVAEAGRRSCVADAKLMLC